MLEPFSGAGAAARVRVMAAALALGRSLDLWSLALVVISLLSLLGAWMPLASKICLLISLLAGATQKIFALRVAFDAALFQHWAENWSRAAADSGSVLQAEDVAGLDQTLVICGLRAHQDATPRDLDSRLRGAWKLLRTQLLALAVQLAASIVAVAAMLLPAV